MNELSERAAEPDSASPSLAAKSVTKRRRRLLLALTSVLFSLLLIEITLQVAVRILPKPLGRLGLWAYPQPSVVPDSRRGHSPNLAFFDHDSRGYRNPSAFPEAAAVVLGDSQTYGSGVASEQAWPRELARLFGDPRKVYNLGVGGWGPGEHLLTIDEALALKPSLVVEAIYSGNDVFDSYRTVYRRGQLPELKSTDPKTLSEAQRRENSDQDSELAEDTEAPAEPTAAGIRGILGDRCITYQLLSRLKSAVSERTDGRWKSALAAARNNSSMEVLDTLAIRTILTSERRRVALDDSDPRVAEGVRIALTAVKKTAERVKEAKTGFLVVLIPTKELVVKETAENAGIPLSTAYRELIRLEERFWARAKETLQQAGIPFFDTLPALRESCERGRGPYPPGADGHPTPEGHRAIAKAVLSAIEKHGLLATKG